MLSDVLEMLFYYKKVILTGNNLHSAYSIVTENIAYINLPVKTGNIEIGRKNIL
jgi:hypothetical protein